MVRQLTLVRSIMRRRGLQLSKMAIASSFDKRRSFLKEMTAGSEPCSELCVRVSTCFAMHSVSRDAQTSCRRGAYEYMSRR